MGGTLPGSRLAAAAAAAAAQYGTPLYLRDEALLDAAAAALEVAFPDPWLRAYSLKADPAPGLVARLAARGWAANGVSNGELAAARKAGLPNDRITLEGIGKGAEELDGAIRASLDGEPLRWISLESLDEARDLAARAAVAGLGERRPLQLLVRVNPAIEPGTHRGLAVGRAGSKFGAGPDELVEIARLVAGAPGLELIGVHLHAGSQLRDLSAWGAAVGRALAAYGDLASSGLLHARAASIGTLCLGGGMPVGLDGDDDPVAQAASFRSAADAAIDAARRGGSALPSRLAIEPGRAIVAASTILVARVLHVRDRAEQAEDGTVCARQVVLDAGMTDLIRPALYGARHPVVALERQGAAVPTAVHGPICESTDSFGAHELPEMIARGDLVAILGAGAYGDAMWSPYNSRPRAARVSLDGDGSLRLERRRGAA